VLRVIPLGSSDAFARAALRARAFSVQSDADPGRPAVIWISGDKTWCTGLKCCVTEVGVEVTAGRVTNALAYDYEYGRFFRVPAINSMFGPATCA
jgi:hypothetical protein